MNTITRDVQQAREALRGLMAGGADPLVIRFNLGFVGKCGSGFTFDPASADTFTTQEEAAAMASRLAASYTKSESFQVVRLRSALAHRLLDLHQAMGLF